MNRFAKFFLLSFLLGIFAIPMTSYAQTSISLDHVDGDFDGKIAADTPIKFHIRWVNNSGEKMGGVAMGYRVFLRNNVELPTGNFEPVAINTIPGYYYGFDFYYGTYEASDGVGADTVGFGGAILSGPGLPDGYDDIAYEITTSVSLDYVGDSLCLDSSFYPPSGTWKWSAGANPYYPDWSGPHCYEIAASCCSGLRGNFNNSPDDMIDISDLVQLVSYMFSAGVAPECFEEADFNGLGGVDISDLVLMVDFMFQGGMPPTNCF